MLNLAGAVGHVLQPTSESAAQGNSDERRCLSFLLIPTLQSAQSKDFSPQPA